MNDDEIEYQSSFELRDDVNWSFSAMLSDSDLALIRQAAMMVEEDLSTFIIQSAMMMASRILKIINTEN